MSQVEEKPILFNPKNDTDVADRFKKAKRDMEICNSCRYCESVCPVFPQITQYRTFDEAKINYLANLCHNCKACYHGCQYAPPHEFAVNIPKTFSEIRVDSYTRYAFPRAFGKLFANNATVVSIMIALCIFLLFVGGIALNNGGSLWVPYNGEGSFFQVIPLSLMSGVPLVVCTFVMVVFVVGFVRFWRDNGDELSDLKDISLWVLALKSVATMKHLNGGDNAHGCNHVDDRFQHNRRWYHQAVMYGFLLTFLSTSIASFYHYVLGISAPYDYFSLVVITGTVGGILIVIGCVGLMSIKMKTDPKPVSQQLLGMDYAFIISLALVSFTGLILLAFRETALMPTLLCLHLGFVLAFFALMPYSKFVHSLYRLAALLKYAKYLKNQ